MRVLKLLIVDDEPLAHKVLEDYCEGIDYVQVIGNCYDSRSALNFLNKDFSDAILLDIQMPDLTGVELLDVLKERTHKIIFTTAHTDFALQSFEYDQVIDYLHKPIRLTRFMKSIERLKRLLANNPPNTSGSRINDSFVTPSSSICFKDNGVTSIIDVGTILYIQSWGNYIKAYLQNGQVKITRKTMNELEGTLPPTLFIRIHKSYIVNVKNVESIKGNQVFIMGVAIPIGKSFRMMIKKRFS